MRHTTSRCGSRRRSESTSSGKDARGAVTAAGTNCSPLQAIPIGIAAAGVLPKTKRAPGRPAGIHSKSRESSGPRFIEATGSSSTRASSCRARCVLPNDAALRGTRAAWRRARHWPATLRRAAARPSPIRTVEVTRQDHQRRPLAPAARDRRERRGLSIGEFGFLPWNRGSRSSRPQRTRVGAGRASSNGCARAPYAK